MLESLFLFAQAVSSNVNSAAEVATHAVGENRALEWPAAAVLITLVGTVGLAIIASLRSKHDFGRDVKTGSSVKTNSKAGK